MPLATPYADSRREASAPPVTAVLPAFVLILNYPPTMAPQSTVAAPTDAGAAAQEVLDLSSIRDVLALYMPFHKMFDGRAVRAGMKEWYAKQKRPPEAFPFSRYNEDIFTIVPTAEPLRLFKRYLYGGHGRYGLHAYNFMHYAADRYDDTFYDRGQRDPVKLISVEETGLRAVRAFMADADVTSREIYKSDTVAEFKQEFDEHGGLETEMVTGMDGVMFRVFGILPDDVPIAQAIQSSELTLTRIVGGLLTTTAVTAYFRKKQSAFEPDTLAWESADVDSDLTDSEKKDANYKRVCAALIAEARKINLLLNVLQPGDVTAIPTDLRVEIGGHTDRSGTTRENKTLSEARANSIKAFLEETDTKTKILKTSVSVNPMPDLLVNRLVARGYGEAESPESPTDHLPSRKITFRLV
jgi:outer membrane protein OmpA-like peptidoglycan-associated protein